MKKLLQGLTFSYNPNMGWKDRTIRAVVGLVQPVLSLAELIDGKIEVFLEIFTVFILLTSLTGKCFIYFLTGTCTNKSQSDDDNDLSSNPEILVNTEQHEVETR